MSDSSPHDDSRRPHDDDAPGDASGAAPNDDATGSDAGDDAGPSPSSASPASTSGAAASTGDESQASDTTSGKGVAPEKAPSKRTKRASGASDGDDNPAAGLKGLQKGEEGKRRGLLARSKRLQSLITSNRPLGVRNMLWAITAVLAVVVLLLAATGRIGTVTQSIADSFGGAETDARGGGEGESLEEVSDEGPGGEFTFAQLAGHPDNMLQPYFAGAVAGAGGGAKSRSELIEKFRALTDQYVRRYGEDDNFSMRISSGGEQDTLLEVFTLEEERQKYLDAGEPEDYNFDRVNSLRRAKTRELVDKWVSRGVPQDPIRVKWGMATKTRAARTRDLPFIEYEIRLARFFGKSLLMTEIGTKETFNQDELVSPVDAKSRYQLMPALLSEYDIHRYRLSTTAGNTVLVAEEQHPLITMEPSFSHAAASVNAMGHEIPGVSAYHTGVNNIYNHILVKFLKNAQDYITPGVTTADAYIWGVTEGFPVVSRNSSFGDFSRTYVVGAYGALKATEKAVIDTSQTMLADRMQLASGQSITLDDLLSTLAGNGGGDLPWKAPDSLSLYTRFARMNKHFHLPSGPGGSADSVAVGVPERGNVQLSATAGGNVVRFFLPPGARTILANNGLGDLIDESSVFRFNHDTYPDPGSGIRTQYDREYTDLIEEIRHFGFTDENRQKLKRLEQQFEQMAASSDASHYRKAMANIIDKHRQFWRYPGWEDVKNVAQAVLARTPTQPQGPEELDTQPLETPSDAGSDGSAQAGR